MGGGGKRVRADSSGPLQFSFAVQTISFTLEELQTMAHEDLRSLAKAIVLASAAPIPPDASREEIIARLIQSSIR